MFVSIKTKRSFNNFRSFINHLNHNYPTLLDAYLFEKEIKEIPKCPFCEQNRKFKGWKDGFQQTCGNKDCLRKLSKIFNTQIGTKAKDFFVEGYDEFVKNNIDFYKENFHKINIVDPFNNIKSKRYLSLVVARKIKNKNVLTNEYWFEERQCECCKKIFNISIFSDRTRCSEKCYRVKEGKTLPLDFENGFNINEFRALPKKDKNIVAYFYDSFFGYYVPLRKHKQGFENFYYKRKNVDKLEYCRHHRLSINCIVCEKEYIKYRPNILDYNFNFLKDKKELNHCSNRNCYRICVKNRMFKNLFSKETGDKISKSLIEKIKNGYNPKATNSWCNSRITVEGNHFRSSWELAFFIINQDKELEFESIRIPYFYKGKNRNYITDFVDRSNNVIYEIKPKECLKNEQIKIKTYSAINWCLTNNYEYVIIGLDYFLKHKIFLEENLNFFPDLRKILGAIYTYERKFC